MALTSEQELALLALLDEPQITLAELPVAKSLSAEDLFLTRQGTTECSANGEVMKQFLSPPASTVKSGIVRLSNNIEPDNEQDAVTPKAVHDVLMQHERSNNHPDGSLAKKGMVQLSNAIDSSSELLAATPNAVKSAFDKLTNQLLPAWAPIACPMETAPAGYLKCNGATFDREKFPELARGYPSGVLPDLRGEFVRGWDDGRGIDVGRVLLSSQADMLKEHSHGYYNNSAGTSAAPTLGATLSNFIVNRTTDSFGGVETRPRNVAFLYIVRAA